MTAMSLHVDVITPEKLALSWDADSVVAPAADGLMGILPGHIPLLTKLGNGELRLKKGNETLYFAISGGFLEVKEKNQIHVFAETAALPQEIDIEKEKLEAKKAKEKLSQSVDLTDDELAKVEGALSRAVARLKVAQTRRQKAPPPGIH